MSGKTRGPAAKRGGKPVVTVNQPKAGVPGPGQLTDDTHPFADLVDTHTLARRKGPTRPRKEPQEEVSDADAPEDDPAVGTKGQVTAPSEEAEVQSSPYPPSPILSPFPVSGDLATKHDVKVRVMRRLGRDRLLECLRYCDDRRLLKFAHALADPQNNERDLDQIYRECGLSVVDLLGAFRRFQLDLAMIDLFEMLPAVSRDAARVALSRRGNCRRCDGLKKVQDEKDGPYRMCPECRGDGWIRVPGDSQARAAVLDAAGLTGKKAVIKVPLFPGDEAFETDISRVVVVPAREVKE